MQVAITLLEPWLPALQRHRNGLLGCRTVLKVAGWPSQVEANGDTLQFPAVRSVYIQSCTEYEGEEWTSTTLLL